MCCDLFSQYVWVCIFVCCVFTSFRPGEGAELAKPPLLISLRSGASSQTSECRLQHSHSVFLMTSHCQMKHSRVTLFCSSRAESCAYLFCQLPLTPNQKYTGLVASPLKDMCSIHKHQSFDWRCNYPPGVHENKQTTHRNSQNKTLMVWDACGNDRNTLPY